MAATPEKTALNHVSRRVAIAIELDHAYPWHHDCYQGVLKYGQEACWTCIVDPFLVGISDHAGQEQYEGVVGRLDLETEAIARANGIPMVSHWGNAPSRDLPSVLMDEIAVGRVSAEHLMACGFRRFAFVGTRDSRPGDQQLEGFTQTVVGRGLQSPKVWAYTTAFEESRETLTQFRRELIAWLSGMNPPVGVAAANATAARYIVQICSELKLKVPEDIGVIVLSSDYSSDTGTPGITSVGQDYLKLGYEAAKLLDQIMQGKETYPLQRSIAPGKVHVRDSTATFFCEDELVRDAMQFITQHADQSYSIEDIADALYTSESTLRRRFQRVVGRSIREEMVRHRIGRITSLLVETEMPLATISIECGFSSPTQFARYFSSATGMTPSAYRKQHFADA
jgi:LacI family transcriptional regulator